MANFAIRLGIPEMLAYWQHLSTEAAQGTLGKDEQQLYQKWGQAMAHLAMNPFYPSLHTHEIPPLSKRYGMKVFQSYLENRNSRAARMYWVYGPDHQDITVIGLEPHPEDKKNGGYRKVQLSDLPKIQP
jgi:hypothetical protein